MKIITLEKLSSCSKMSARSSRRPRKSSNTTSITKESWGSNSKTNSSNLRISSVENRFWFPSSSLKSITCFTRTKTWSSIIKGSGINWRGSKISTVGKFTNWKLNFLWKPGTTKIWQISTTLSFKNSRKKAKITLSRSLSILRGRSKIYKRESK